MTATATRWEAILDGEEVVHLATEPAARARTEPLPVDLHPRVKQALGRGGIDELYTHQADTWRAARRGEHVLVATGTASGKSLAFNLPVLDALATDPKCRALYLYPTKALAQDQARALSAIGVPRVRAAIYDGDTPPEQRGQVRRWANVILTNPDMLHVGILPHHDRWADVLANLRHVVVDEAHVYRGVFGSHVANVLRRLIRASHLHGARPQVVLATATIGNPRELAEMLLGADVTVVATDGAPRAERTVCLWNPELVDPELNLRASALGDAARLLADLVVRGQRTICFARSRKAAELVHRFASDRLDPELAGRLSPYRAGYTPEQRRGIERRLVEGELLGVTTTDALELGIDVGHLDCAIAVGFPGTVASLRQQWGRAGRRRPGLAVMVASEDSLDQFFMRQPEALLARAVEAAILDHANPRILDGHLLAAAYEAPIVEADRATLGHAAVDRARRIVDRGALRQTAAGIVWAGRDYPASRVSLRSAGGRAVTVVEADTGAVLGEVEEHRAPSTVHDGAVYLHLGETFEVVSNDGSVALVKPFGGDYYTQAKRETAIALVEARDTALRLGTPLSFGRVSVTEQVVGYQRRSIRGSEVLGRVPLVMPAISFETEAIWFSPDSRQLAGLEQMPRLLGALHAAEHALIALLPLWAMCDRWDIGGLSTNLHPDTLEPTIIVYDGHAGGVGITERGFARFEGWVADTERLLAGCPCDRGCPSCVQSPKCGNLNEPLDKDGALLLLRRLLGPAGA